LTEVIPIKSERIKSKEAKHGSKDVSPSTEASDQPDGNAANVLLTSGMSIISLVVRHVYAQRRVVCHGFHVINDHVPVLLLVAEHRILTCGKYRTNEVSEIWTSAANVDERDG